MAAEGRRVPPALAALFAGLPLGGAWRALRRKRDRGALALAALIAAYGLVALATPWWPALQRALAEAHHLRPRSLLRWIALQPAPKMYSFSHRVWIGPYPLFGRLREAEAEARFARQLFWVNHYPARRARFDGARDETLGSRPHVRWIYLDTSYRGHRLRTGYEARLVDGRLVLTLVQAAP